MLCGFACFGGFLYHYYVRFSYEIINLHVVDAKAKTKWNKSKTIGGCGYRFGHALPPDIEGIGEESLRLQQAQKHQGRRGLKSIDPQYLDDLRDDKVMLAGVRHILGCEPEYTAGMQGERGDERQRMVCAVYL